MSRPSPVLGSLAPALPRVVLLAVLGACHATPSHLPSPTPDAKVGTPSPSTSAANPAPASSAEPAVPQSAPSAPAEPSNVPESPPAAQATPDAPPPEEDGMLLVPGGPFTMGSDDVGEADEHPRHVVEIPAFFLDRTEVTNADYERCVSAGVCRAHDTRSSRLNHFGDDRAFRAPTQPISAVSWEDAQAYCHFVGKRLPREAEWEKAARGTDARTYPWGEAKPTAQHAVFSTNRTAPVGTHPLGVGPYGHLDLTGNVWEWMQDDYDPDAYRRTTAPQGVPAGCPEILRTQDALRHAGRQGYTGSNPIPTECEKVLRGGAFNYVLHGLRASNRVHHPARYRLIMAGFRCAKDAAAPSQP